MSFSLVVVVGLRSVSVLISDFSSSFNRMRTKGLTVEYGSSVVSGTSGQLSV